MDRGYPSGVTFGEGMPFVKWEGVDYRLKLLLALPPGPLIGV